MKTEDAVAAIERAESRDHAASTYADALAAWSMDDGSDCWAVLNHAVSQRWSQAGLLYVKKMAWAYNADRTVVAVRALNARACRPAADRALDAEALLEEAQAMLTRLLGGTAGPGSLSHEQAVKDARRLLQRLRARKQADSSPTGKEK